MSPFMYFRLKKTPSGKVLQLLESYRDNQGQPRNRVVLSLGNANIPKEQQPLVAKAVEKHLYGAQELFPWSYTEDVQKWIDLIVRRVDLQGRWHPSKSSDEDANTMDGVFIEQIGHEETAELGAVLLGHYAWKQLRMDECLGSLGFNEAQKLAAATNIINRLVEPVSENALTDWLRYSAMPELFGGKVLQLRKDQFYRVTDKLLEKARQIESHIRQRHRELFSLKRTLFLYDLTNTYFEGSAKKNPIAKRGNSKEKRNDCPQVVLGMVFDENGFELGHKIFDGNRNDSTTLIEMVKTLQDIVAEEASLFHIEKPIVVMDGGVASKRNRELLRAQGFNYLVNETRSGRKKWREQFMEDEKFKTITGRDKKTPVKIRVVADTESTYDTMVLCKSEGRRQKEEAIYSKAEIKYLDALKRLAVRINKGALKDRVKIERAIGRLQAKHTRANRFYQVDVKERQNAGRKGNIYVLEWHRKDEVHRDNDDLLGCYVLRTDWKCVGANRESFTGEEIWRLYMTLTRAEDGFRSLKSHLGLRPIRHQTENRTNAHTFITILAYHLLRSIMYPLERGGDTRNWQTLKRVLSTHCYTSIIVPTKDGSYRIRKASRPDTMQKAIYKALGINWKSLPKKTVKTP